ncbi:MAG: hypothetical protein WA373_17470 [Burkholderiales bacterium]
MADKSVTYNPEVIQEFAERLYRQARSIILSSTLLGIFGGAIVGAIGVSLIHAQQHIGVAALIGALVVGFSGYLRGKERAFKLKLEAQVALCNVQIEKNTANKHS